MTTESKRSLESTREQRTLVRGEDEPQVIYVTQPANWGRRILLTVGTLVPAFAGVVLAHYYLLGARRRPAEELIAKIDPGVRWTGIISLIGGASVAFFIKGGVPALQGLIASGILYLALELIYERVAGRSAESTRFVNP